MRRLLAPLTAALVLLSAPAAATPPPPPDPYVLALWKSTDPDGGQWPQVLVVAHTTADTDLTALDGSMDCGGVYQVDLYANDATTAALIAGGYLTSPGVPRESWPGGRYRPEFSRVVTTEPCPPPPVDPPTNPPADPPADDDPPTAPPAEPKPAAPNFTG